MLRQLFLVNLNGVETPPPSSGTLLWYLKDDGRQCGLVVSILISLRLRFFLPVLLIRFQGLPQPACYIRLKTHTIKQTGVNTFNWFAFIYSDMLALNVSVTLHSAVQQKVEGQERSCGTQQGSTQ